jgi:superfamily I DNA and RNA helicase
MLFKSAINYTRLGNDAASKEFLNLLDNKYTTDASILDDIYVYYEKPSFNLLWEDLRIFPSFLVIWKKIGINIVICTSQAIWVDIETRLKEVDRHLYAHILKNTPEIVSSNWRMLKCSVKSKIFTTTTEEPETFDLANIIYNYPDIKRVLLEKDWDTDELTDDEFRYLQATIDWSRSLRKKETRVIENPIVQKKWVILKRIEEEINIFDKEQRNAALVTHDWPLRIRWLAWSWKTIILARKVATSHEEDPNAKILVTYNTKVLKEYIQELISWFYRETNDTAPNWDKIDIMHAWWWAGLEWVYFNACIDNYIRPVNLQEARDNNFENPFDYACQQIIKHDLNKKYDYCLIDEAQDFNPSFYQLCYRITKNKRIVWAYDEFQNILESDIQNERETFWVDSTGKNYIDFRDYPHWDSILEITYRNPRLIIISAFSLWMWIYSTSHLVQRIWSNQHWKDLWFKILNWNASTDWSEMQITRPESSTSRIKNDLLCNHAEIIKLKSFLSITEEANEIISDILLDLKEWLRHDDIMIICMDWTAMHQYLNLLREWLLKNWIEIFDLFKGEKNSQSFKYPKMITFSSIHKAKWNESWKVYVIGTDRIFRLKDDIKERNKLFTAITRAKGWVTITWVWAKMDECIAEYNKLRDAEFEFRFMQPSEQEVKTLAHEMEQEARRIDELRKQLEKQAKANNMSLDDLLETLKMK